MKEKRIFEKEKEKMSMPRPVVTTETPITVNVSKSQGYIWDASDAIKLRDEHRVLGLAVGSLANHNSQNQVRMNGIYVVGCGEEEDVQRVPLELPHLLCRTLVCIPGLSFGQAYALQYVCHED